MRSKKNKKIEIDKSKFSAQTICRGKRLDNGEWVKGYYIYSRFYDAHYIVISNYAQYTGGGQQFANTIFTTAFKVDPKTVGRRVNVRDRKFVEIYEDDIIKWDEREWGCPYCELVKWDYELLEMRKNDWHEWCEVIGNAHDNPELLEKVE